MYIIDFYKIILISLFFIIYKWIIVFIHELGHYTIATLFGHESKIEFEMKKNLMPTMRTKIHCNRDFNCLENILITSGGVLFQIAMTTILISQNICLELSKIATFYLMSIFLNFIPVKATDGYYLNKILKEKNILRNSSVIKSITLAQWLMPIILIILIPIDIIKMSILGFQTLDFNLLGLSILGYIIAATSMICIKKFYNNKYA